MDWRAFTCWTFDAVIRFSDSLDGWKRRASHCSESGCLFKSYSSPLCPTGIHCTHPFSGSFSAGPCLSYKTNYEDENGQHINFPYRFRIAGKLVFVAESSDKDLDTLCVKFTRRYSEDAHHFLAQLGCAPRLRAVMRLPGGWNMVVMDYSEYMQLCDPMLQISDELRLHTIMAKVSEVVQKLHDAGFVHGDIRSPNVLIDCKTLTSKDGIKTRISYGLTTGDYVHGTAW